MNTKQTLIAARAKIADPANWVQNYLAVDINGLNKPPTHPMANKIHWEGLTGNDPMACQWCAIGAVQAVTGDDQGIEFTAARTHLDRAARELFGVYAIVEVNDDQDHASVLAVFDKAILTAIRFREISTWRLK